MFFFFFSSRRRHTRCALVTGVQTCALPILLQRRPASGVWAALWSLPEAGEHVQARDWFSAHVDGDYDAGAPLAAIAHGFTHYKLQLQPVRWREVALRPRVADNDDLRWVARADMVALGIPAPIRKLLECIAT